MTIDPALYVCATPSQKFSQLLGLTREVLKFAVSPQGGIKAGFKYASEFRETVLLLGERKHLIDWSLLPLDQRAAAFCLKALEEMEMHKVRAEYSGKPPRLPTLTESPPLR